MRIEELIENLKKYPSNTEVVFETRMRDCQCKHPPDFVWNIKEHYNHMGLLILRGNQTLLIDPRSVDEMK